LLGALSSFPESPAPGSDSSRALHAAVLLAAGRVDVAESDLKNIQGSSPFAGALRELVAAVKHQPVSPLTVPGTGSEWIARSYYFQSRGQLTEALEAARQASMKSPRFGAAWVRVAELEFGFGHTDQALAALDKGLQLSPKNAEGLALKGFLLSAQNHFAEAMNYFDQAIAADGALGNAWLGRGLVRIRKGQNHEGLSDLQVAATLEPQRSILRSYLGKAFSDNYDVPHARKELGMAQQLDPNDPTSWLYMALLDQEGNRINEAINDLERSKELNQNRSVFRSRLLLDQDQAVRGANLASIYRDAGMFDRSVQEASRAVNNDYANYSAHLFLANSYDTLRDPKLINLRYETPWFSELLVANLLMPVNGGNLSQNISQQEYSKLFASDGMGIFSRTEYSSHGDWIEKGSVYGVFGQTSFSIDGDYRSERGFRPNNDLEQRGGAARIKQQITEKDSVFVQVGLFYSESGDVAQYYNQTNASRTFRAEEDQEPSLLVGYHREWSPGNHTLFLFGRIDDTLKLKDPASAALAHTTFTFIDTGGNLVTNDFLSNLSGTDFHYHSDLEAYSTELQQIWQTHELTFIGGGRYQFAWADTSSRLDRPPPNPISTPIASHQSFDSELDRFSVYGYGNWQILDSLSLSAGVTYDQLHYPRNIDTAPIIDSESTEEHLSPKGGVIWSPLKDTHLRGYYSQSLGGAFFDQSVRLEPVQIAGFNQAYRSLIPESVAGQVPATRFETWGFGWDQRIEKTGTYLFAQFEWLDSDATRAVGILTNDVTGGSPLTPDQASSTRESLDYTEKALILALNQLIGKEWSLGVRYKMTYADLQAKFKQLSSASGSAFLNQDVQSTLHQVNLFAIYQHRCGFFAEFDAIWSQQSNRNYTPDIPGDDFWQFDFYAGYRFLQRRAEVRIGVLNLTDEDYKLNPLTLYNELPRERMVTASLKLNF
jgi:tetratricopeptide (TPR) repeat protein